MSAAPRDKSSVATAASGGTALVDRVLFYILLALLAARPMIGETFEPLQVSFLAALPNVSGPSPATTAWLDLLTLTAASLAVARRGRWRRSRVALAAVGLLAVAAVVSSVAAGDTHVARLAAASLVIGIVAGLALLVLAERRWMVNVVLAALLATGSTTALKCITQVYYDYPQTRVFWEQEQKPALLKQGFDLEDPLIVNFERRMWASEPQGFLTHPNVTASCLALAGLACAGLAAAALALRLWPRAVLALLLVVLLGFALWLTGSLGAQVAVAVGVVSLLIGGFAARWISARSRLILALLGAGYFGLIAIVAAAGIARGTLPHPSLEFRWYYWTAAARAYEDVPWTGLGRENFVFAYTHYKSAASTEEVRNPHNVWLSLMVEMGPLGFVGGALLAGLALWLALRRLDGRVPELDGDAAVNWQHAAPLVIGVLAMQAAFSATPFEQPGIALIWMQEVAFAWVAALVLGLWIIAGLEGKRRWLVAGIAAVVAATLVHGLVDYAPLTPGGLCMLMLAVAALGVQRADVTPAPRSKIVARIVPFAAIGLAALHLLLVVMPTQMSTSMLRRIDTALRAGPTGDDALYLFGYVKLGLSGSPTVAREAAQALMQRARQEPADGGGRERWLSFAQRSAERAVQINPVDTGNHSVLARVHAELAQYYAGGRFPNAAETAWLAAAQSWGDAVARYPTNPRTRIAAARAWMEVWQGCGDPDAARRAREHLEQALWINDQRAPQDTVRLQPKEHAEINRLRAALPHASHSAISSEEAE